MIWLAAVLCAFVTLSALAYARHGRDLWRMRRANRRARRAMGAAFVPALRELVRECEALLGRRDLW